MKELGHDSLQCCAKHVTGIQKDRDNGRGRGSAGWEMGCAMEEVGVKGIDIGHLFSIWPGLEMSSTFSNTCPLSIRQLSVFLAGSGVIVFPFPLTLREGYEIPLLMSKTQAETLLWSNLRGFSSAKEKHGAFLPVSNAALHCEGSLQKPLLLRARSPKAGKVAKLCLFQGRGNAHTTQGSKTQSSRSNSFRICTFGLGSRGSSPASHARLNCMLNYI